MFLIVSKIFELVHIDTEFGYLDIDRVAGLIVFLIVYQRFYDKQSIRFIPILILLSVLYALLPSFFGLGGFGWEKLLTLFFLTAMVEEILLRGVVFHFLLKILNRHQTIFVSSLFFTLVHPVIYGNYGYAMSVFIAGVILGYIYMAFKNNSAGIVAATFSHALIILLGLMVGAI